MSAGIDYGLGKTNIDTATGIRYGVISMYDISQAWCNSSEAEYGSPHCPKCGEVVGEASGIEYDDTDYEQYHGGCADWVCHECKHTLDAGDVTPDEPLGFTYDGDGYRAESCLDSDVIVTLSPYYTYGPFCSPCVPGAVNLNSALPPGDKEPGRVGVRAYCFGHDWFDDGKTPYRVFRVSDDTEVFLDV